MATSLYLQSGSLFIGNPINVAITANTVESCTFHRVKLQVTASRAFSGTVHGATTRTEELSAPVESGETVYIDISSVLRAVCSDFRHEPVSDTVEYPYLTYSLSAYDEYMVDGDLYTNIGPISYGQSMTALMGAFTDMERFTADYKTRNVISFSRKPATGEVCSPDHMLVYPQKPESDLTWTGGVSSGPTVKCASLTGLSGPQSFGGRTVYIDNSPANRILFQFVNGCGVVESISAEMLESRESGFSVEQEMITGIHAFDEVGRRTVRKETKGTVFTCSTGYVNEEWADWWITEFLGGDKFRRSGHNQCWMWRGGQWVPCLVVPSDKTKVYDRTKPELLHMEFEVHICWDGIA